MATGGRLKQGEVMFIVSGTKRSGTSMWMQALAAAGVPVTGEKFPKQWEQGALKEANPDGFYEDIYRDGVFFATNPHPHTGRYLEAEESRGTVVKVFIPGVVRTERGYIEGVIANVREWREYEASVERLWDLDDVQRAQEQSKPSGVDRLPAALEWWSENYALIRDHLCRQYPLVLQTYAQVLEDPSRHVGAALDRIGSGNLEEAVAAIKPERKTQSRRSSNSVDDDTAKVFDAFYESVAMGERFSPALLSDMAALHKRLQPRLIEAKIQRARQLVLAGGPPSPALMLAASMS